MKTVLITDDEYLIRWSLSQAMRDRFLVFTAENADEALDILKRAHVDAIVMDLKLPGRDGIEFAEIVLRKYPALPVIVLTAYGCPALYRHLTEIGVRACIDKPCDVRRLAELIEEHLAPIHEHAPLRLEYAGHKE